MNGTEPMIRLVGVRKTFPGGDAARPAVADLDLDVGRGELCVLVGPSGCGKTTTMRMINRLIEPSGGRIHIDGEDVTDADPVQLRRHIGYVIQNVGLFPHRTVRQNVATVPHLLGWDKRRTAERVAELLELVGLPTAEYGDRYPDALSGGQRQRVGVARALAAGPKVLLMDEPFSAVDPLVRDRLQVEFRGLQQTLGTTVVLVTHDVAEAVRLGDRIAVMSEGGRMEQYADPATVLGRPASPFVASFVGEDRSLKRLSVTFLGLADLDDPAGASLGGRTTVTLGTDLRRAMAAVLDSPDGRVPVTDGGSLAGVLTPLGLHRAFRRSLPPE